jgi:hypothetical protein
MLQTLKDRQEAKETLAKTKNDTSSYTKFKPTTQNHQNVIKHKTNIKYYINGKTSKFMEIETHNHVQIQDLQSSKFLQLSSIQHTRKNPPNATNAFAIMCN